MSKVKGVFPLFLATAFGIGNGIWVFGPALKEQQENNLQEKAALEHPIQTQESETARIAEVEASRAASKDALLNSSSTASPWWQSARFWSSPQPPSNSSSGSQPKELATEAKKS
ncbi:hypothetical protein SS1G_05325 [Sclerotinia sclerotiorum 1980 UF-70]|uniref:Uncharacterized protein n=2 Tax=Sclerotinia sclerotiorum (strain ATCC 18683 / 1980 / Ss-1) TaxID=665079 RepID=A7EJ32_SCLS1|nr:hypothetical protein SS1G_05325 [Sclerotinia sclerotiorum 1980 UF-70]APA11821.1 hypothetical protein sscle_08g065910 [Sclerotinia sclerotiorum 1980 UF-70]EDO02848.1 hypothetical protein SS1G_05325 [Sclerotinia sclerotiorum 1980 UF-70]